MAITKSSELIQNYIYLFHTDEYLILPEYPDTISDKMDSRFSQTNALSRTAPVFAYSNSGPRTVNFQLNLHRDLMDDVNTGSSNVELDLDEDYIDVLVRKIQEIALPVYSASNKMVTPPMIAVKLGREIFIKGVVIGGVSIDYQKPVLDDERYANITISFNIYEIDPYDAQSVGQLGSFRGITQQFKDGII